MINFIDSFLRQQSEQPEDFVLRVELQGGEGVTLICHRLLSQWKTDLNSALAAMEILAGLAKLVISPPNLLMCKCTVKWICEFIVQQCNRPAPAHSKDLHSTIVAAFRCLSLWLVEHSRLLYDKECLHVVLEVVELGISGSKSQVTLTIQLTMEMVAVMCAITGRLGFSVKTNIP